MLVEVKSTSGNTQLGARILIPIYCIISLISKVTQKPEKGRLGNADKRGIAMCMGVLCSSDGIAELFWNW